MKIPDDACKISDGIWEVEISETARDQHMGWDSLDSFVESAAMTTNADRGFESRGQSYALLLRGTSIVSRLDEPNQRDRYRLSSCAVVIYLGDRERPLYFINQDDGLAAWNRLCIDLGHLEAMFKDELPPTGNVYLN